MAFFLMALIGGVNSAWADDAITATWFSGNNSTTATISPSNENVTTTATAGTGYSIGSTRGSVKLGNGTVTAVNIPIAATTVAADAYVELVSFSLTPKGGYIFSPTSISFYACTQSFGSKTDESNAVLAYEVLNGGSAIKSKTNVSIGRNDGGTGLTQITANFSDVTCEANNALVLKVYLRNYSQTSSKNIVLYNIVFGGSVGADAGTYYDMTASVDDAAHGTAEVSASSVREGNSATFTATSKTGYKFVNWTDTDTGDEVSTDNPYTIASVSEAVSLTANFTNAYSISYNVTDGSRGTTTTGLGTEYTNDADKFTAPVNYYIFKANSTLTSWKDEEENSYIPGTEYTLTKNITLEPVFTTNTKTLNDRTAQTVVTWSFNYVGGEAPAISIENKTGYYIKQATIDGVTTDIVMAIDNTTGSAIEGVYGKTLNNYDKETQSNRTYAQVNRGAKWTIPAVKGMTIVAYSANGNFLAADDETDADESKWKYATRIAGEVASSGTGTQTATWVYNGEASTIDYVAGNDAGYISKIVVTYPSPYSVTYEGNGATSGSTTDANKYDYNAKVTTQANGFTKTGNVFAGWNTEADGSGTAVAAGAKFTITDNTTLYAQWIEGIETTITYNLKTNSSSTTLDNCTTATPTSGDIIASTTINTYGTADCDGTESAKADETQKLKIDDEYTAANYYEWTFTVGSNAYFTPTQVVMKFQAVSDLTQYKVELTDGTTSHTTNFVQTTSAGGTLETMTWNITPGTAFAAGTTGRLKLWAYKKNSKATAFRLGSPITIKGVNTTAVSGTITPAGWSTFASSYPLDLSKVTATSGATAYYASAASESTVTLTPTGDVTVPAGEGIMVKGTAGETFTIGVAASGNAIEDNLLKGQTTTGNVDASNKNENGKYHYVFGFATANPTTTYGFYNLASDTELAAGKAYLETTTALTQGARISIVFDDEETGINDVKNVQKNDNRYYNLNGLEVAQPTKGLYIVNGKKVVIK